ncbi:MAG: tRNA threonylcarbamoyladenosine dehydratase [Bacteroides sp.]|nr:tRNA threonylcarbamoyladenosine dehydratase [Bacteroides sp.]
MEENRDNRTRRLLGDDRFKILQRASVLIVGVGGVGGYAAEMLARTGIGNLTLIDADDVAESNINRQLIATTSTIGQPKVILFAERFHDINPDAKITAIKDYLSPENIDSIIKGKQFDFVIDAIDTVAPKVALLEYCLSNNIRVISSMGAGGRVDPTKIGYFDLWETREDGLAKAVRRKMKADGFRKPLKVVASTEKPCSHSLIEIESANKRSSYGTIATIPSLFGIFLANYVIRKLTNV